MPPYPADAALTVQIYFNEWSAAAWWTRGGLVRPPDKSTGSCDGVPQPRVQPNWRPINRKTLNWNAAAAWWPCGYTQLSTLRGARVVGQDQLPARLGSSERRIQPVQNPQPTAAFVGAYRRAAKAQRVLLLVTKRNETLTVALRGAGAKTGDVATVIGGDLGGFGAPAKRALVGDNATLQLGPFSVAVLALD